jgi:N-acetylmuramoyl-L-alanine amidase
MKVCIDAGHFGRYNRSPANTMYFESVQMWQLSRHLGNALKAKGIDVVYTRVNMNADLGLISRGKKAKGCDLFISLHSNAVANGVNENVDYPVAYVFRDNTRDFLDDRSSAIGLKLAKVVQKTMGTAQEARTATRASSNDRDGNGIKDDEYFGVLEGARQVKVPGVLLEHSFHTNTKSTNWLLSDANLKALANAEAACIASWLKQNSAEPTENHFKVKVTIHNLNIRTGPGTRYSIVRKISKGTYTIVEEKNGWGRLKSGVGWIKLSYTKPLE